MDFLRMNWTMFVFVMSTFISPALGIYFLVMDNNTKRKNITYIVSGIFGILLSIYALNHFRTLFNLKHHIEKHSKLNQHFKKENIALQREVNKLQAAQHELKETHNKLHNLNTQLRENNNAFKTMQENMKTANVNSIHGMQNIFEKMNKVTNCLTMSLSKNERRVLFSLFERFAHKQSSDGMTKEEFDEFSSMLPDTYKETFKTLGVFEKLSNNKSYISYQDFESWLDLFVEMNIKNADIKFMVEIIKSIDSYEDMDAITGNLPQLIRSVQFKTRSLDVEDNNEPMSLDVEDNNEPMSWMV